MILFDIRRSVSLIFQKMSCFTLQRKGKSVLLASQGVIVKPATSHNLLYSLVHLASVDAERMLFGQKTPWSLCLAACRYIRKHAGLAGSTHDSDWASLLLRSLKSTKQFDCTCERCAPSLPDKACGLP